MEAVPKALAFTYRRFLTDLVPGALFVLALVVDGVTHNPSAELTSRFLELADWLKAAFILLLAIPVSTAASSLSNSVFDDFCFSTGAFGWADYLFGSYGSARLREQQLSAVAKKLRGTGAKIVDDDELNILVAARNDARAFASDHLVEHFERLDGLSILFRSLALVALAYSGVALGYQSPWRSAAIAGLVLFFPIAARVAIAIPTRIKRRRRAQILSAIAWPILLLIWTVAFWEATRIAGRGGVVIALFAITMLLLHRTTTERANMEVLATVAYGRETRPMQPPAH